MSSGGNVKMFTSENPDPNPYTGPHKWVSHTGGHPYAECSVCGVKQISPGPGTPDPVPERTPSRDWYAPHEPPTCYPLFVGESEGEKMKKGRSIEVLQRRKDHLKDRLRRKNRKTAEHPYMIAEYRALEFFLNGEDVALIENLKDEIRGLHSKVESLQETARVQTHEAYVARKRLRELGEEI